MGGLSSSSATVIASAHRSPLRIAYFVGAFPSLSETFVINQIVGVAARGHRVDIYATEEVAGHVSPDVERHALLQRTYRVAAPSGRVTRVLSLIALLLVTGWRAPAAIVRIYTVIKRQRGLGGLVRLLYAALTLIRLGRPRYDVIHAQFGIYGVLALQLRQAGVIDGPIVTSFRGYDVGLHLRAHPRAYDELFRVGALFLPVSSTLAERLTAAGCEPKKISVHHSGIWCSRLPYREARMAAGPVRLITVGRLVEKKGVAYTIEAVARVLSAGHDVTYTIVGDGPLRGDLNALVEKHGIGDRVSIVGALPHESVLERMRAAHVLLACSVTAVDGDEEGIPNVLKEAMAIGMPVLATRHGGIAELVKDGVSGFLVPERDVQLIAQRIMHFAARPERWVAMGRAGRAKVETDFDIERLSIELELLYRRAMNTEVHVSNAPPVCTSDMAST